MGDIDEFRTAATRFLRAHAAEKAPERAFVWGEGPDKMPTLEGFDPFEEIDPDAERALLNEARAFRAQRFDAGFGWITGPEEHGGRSLSAEYQRVYDAVEAGFDVPGEVFFLISDGWVAPTVLAHGSDRAKSRYLQALHRGDIVACQLFSEPGAGSDLASLQTRAERDGDDWVITGQKVWSSGAHYADIGELIARTDPDQPKHKGLTAFIVDMRAPGVEVRPLRQMTGGATFNEVFLDEVRVPDDCRIGDVNTGWSVANTTLMNERAAIGGVGESHGPLARAIEMTKALGAAGDPVIRQRLADLVIHSRLMRYTNLRAADKIRTGQTPGPELSISKLAGNQLSTRVADYVAGVLGPKLIADCGEWGTYAWARVVLGTPGLRIGGGTDEIMRNIIAERVLGLPREPAPDATTPFRESRTSTPPS